MFIIFVILAFVCVLIMHEVITGVRKGDLDSFEKIQTAIKMALLCLFLLVCVFMIKIHNQL